MTTQLIKDGMRLAMTAFEDHLTETFFFDISDVVEDRTLAEAEILRSHRPPFERCVVSWQGSTKSHETYQFHMLVSGQDPEAGIGAVIFKGKPNQLQKMNPLMYVVEDRNLKYGAISDEWPVTQEQANVMLGIFANWYYCLSSARQASVPIVRPTFTNQRKIAQGKHPSYEWRTVTIEAKKNKREHQGGTHASPRLHDRRGHLRNLSTGKCVWVRPCKVGSADLGVVFHDYEVRS